MAVAQQPESPPLPPGAGHAPEGERLPVVWERGLPGPRPPAPSGSVHTVETKRNDSSLGRGGPVKPKHRPPSHKSVAAKPAHPHPVPREADRPEAPKQPLK